MSLTVFLKYKMGIRYLKEKVIKNNLLKDSFWAVFGNGIGNALLLFAGILIARFLGKDLYGEYGIVKSTMLYIASFATFGLGFTSTKYIAHQIEEGGEYVKCIIKDSLSVTLTFSGFIALLLLIFAKPIAVYVNAPSLYIAFRALALIIIFKALTTTQIGLLSGFKAFKKIAINSIVSGLIMFICCIPLTYYWGLIGSLSCLFFSQFFNFCINQISINQIRKKLQGQKSKDFKKELIQFSFPVALQESSYTICNWTAIILLTKYSSVGEMGLYSAAAQWNAIILMIPSLLTNVVLSYLSSSINDVSKHKSTVIKMLTVNFFCTLIPFFIVFILADYIASFYGTTFASVSNLLKLLTFATIFECCTSVFKSELMSQGKTWTLFTLRLIRDIILVSAVYIVFVIYGGENGSIKYSSIVVTISVLFFCAMAITYWINYRKKL